MIKWILLIAGLVVGSIFVIALIKYMLKVNKDDKKGANNEPVASEEEYAPQDAPISVHSASAGIPITDMSSSNSNLKDLPSYSGFDDKLDDDFADFSAYARGGKGRRRTPPIDFDLDGDLADEYIPSSPDFNYLPPRQSQKKKSISTELNELPTELKVLMLSDIFDRKFFD